MTDNSIANETPNASTPFPDPARSPLQSPDPKIRRAWQWALSNIRKKNRAGRPPLA
jgi:hypothetical protein